MGGRGGVATRHGDRAELARRLQLSREAYAERDYRQHGIGESRGGEGRCSRHVEIVRPVHAAVPMAPTFARILGLALPGADGAPIPEIVA